MPDLTHAVEPYKQIMRRELTVCAHKLKSLWRLTQYMDEEYRLKNFEAWCKGIHADLDTDLPDIK